MSKRISPEARILDYFDQQPIATAQAIFNLVAARMKVRKANEHEGMPVTPVRKRRPRTKKVLGGMANVYVEPKAEVVA